MRGWRWLEKNLRVLEEVQEQDAGWIVDQDSRDFYGSWTSLDSGLHY